MHNLLLSLSVLTAILPASNFSQSRDVNLDIFDNHCTFVYNNNTFNLYYDDFDFAKTYSYGNEKIIGTYSLELTNLEVINFKILNYSGENAYYSLKVFDYIDSKIVEFCAEDTKIDYFSDSSIIVDSALAQQYINRASNYVSLQLNQPTRARSVNVSTQALEEMTSTDTIFDSYTPGGLPVYQPDLGRYMYPSDTNLTQLIPVEYFYNAGTYHYFGKEYGFYVRTYSPTFVGGFYFHHSEIFLFDIDVEFNNSYNDYFKIKIIPKFNMVVRCGLRSENPPLMRNNSYLSDDITVNFDDLLDNYVITNPYIYFGMENKNLPNYGDYNYNIDSDNGSFISDVRFAVNGITETASSNNGTVAELILNTSNLIVDGLSAAPGPIGQISTIITLFKDFYREAKFIYNLVKESYPTYAEYRIDNNLSQMFNTRYKQKTKYGRIIKEAVLSFEEVNNGVFFPSNDDGDYFIELDVETNIPNEDYEFEQQNICFDYNFNLKLKNENNSSTLLANNGRHQYLGIYDSLSNCFNPNYLRTYQLSAKEQLSIAIQAFYQNEKSCYLFSYTENIKLRMYDQYMNDITSRYTQYAVNGRTYLKNASEDEELAMIIVYNNSNNVNNVNFCASDFSDLNRGTNRVSANNSGSTYSYVPLTSSTHYFETNFGVDVDTCLYVYNRNMVLLAMNDDSDEAYELNSYLEIDLTFGEIYYIKITASDSFTTNGDLYVGHD